MKNTKKKVSIIIPVFNSEEYIGKTIKSVLNQDYQQIELIIVDDGSIDTTKNIVLSFLDLDNRLKYYYQENSGAPAARNYGFKKSSGEYVIFFDADDIMTPFAITNFMKEAEFDDFDLLIGNYKHIVNDTVNLDNVKTPTQIEFLGENIVEKNTNYLLREISFLGPVPGNKMFRRNFLLKNGLEFKNIKIGQDLNFYLSAIANYPRVKIIQDIIFHYRIHEGSISKSYNSSILDIINSLQYLKEDRFIFFSENTDVLNTLKLNHYTFQIIKIPKIKNKQVRKETYSILNNELDKVNKDNIVKEKLTKNYWITQFATSFKNFYISNFFSRIITILNL